VPEGGGEAAGRLATVLFHTLRLRLVRVEQALQGVAELPEEEGDPVNRELCQTRLLGPVSKNYALSA
jgi:hypothetical protein